MIELEYKYLLLKEAYDDIHQLLQKSYEPLYVLNFNYYYDTPDFAFEQNGYTVRIRQVHDQLTLDVKSPSHTKGYKRMRDETSIPIDYFPQKLVLKDWLNTLPATVSCDADLLGLLVTERQTFFLEEGVKADLDKSSYLGVTDYELEIEFESEKSEEAKSWFLKLTDGLEIPTNRKGKRTRFLSRFKQLYEKEECT
ncbi:CYTH domain-containing protein [Bacillus sp. NPDC077027]|uniref:CYTH domain-containing protein n=1 Tax=Bacillus sp. NPDC077027 TaxID=3390548 RepID=UPI003D0868E3